MLQPTNQVLKGMVLEALTMATYVSMQYLAATAQNPPNKKKKT